MRWKHCRRGRLGLSVGTAALAVVVAARPVTADEETPAPEEHVPSADPDVAYDRLVTRGRPHWLRAAVEESLGFTGGLIWYWLTPERQAADWDYPSWQQRVTLEAWRFDNNTFATNYVWHPFGGAGYHVVSRSNDLSLSASIAYGFAASFVWEYLLEFREKVSINDMIVNPGSGIAIGEFGHWLGRYLNSSPRPRDPLRTAARWTLGFWYALHGAMDDRPAPPAGSATDRLGFSADIWHRFTMGHGLVLADAEGTPRSDDEGTRAYQLRVEGELAAMPGYLSPGRLRRFFANGNFTRLRYRGTFPASGVGHDFHADTVVLGYHLQDVAADGSGHAATLGTSMAYTYRREDLGAWTDRLAFLHLPGLAFDPHVLGDGWRLSLRIRLHADLAGIDSAAYPRWKADHPDAVEKTILRKQGYYYAWGVSGRLEVELVLPRLALGGSIFGGRYDSQEGLDRSQESVTHDVDAHDRVADYDTWLRLGPLLGPLTVEVRYVRRTRESRLGGVHTDKTLDRYSLELGAKF